MGKISNVTNDPQSLVSRVFVGNLNTFVLVKEDVERIFRRYGAISAISMHKGFAFIQYSRQPDARNACLGEDQRVYADQALDVNMAGEPKPNRASRKRPASSALAWDFFYNAPAKENGILGNGIINNRSVNDNRLQGLLSNKDSCTTPGGHDLMYSGQGHGGHLLHHQQQQQLSPSNSNATNSSSSSSCNSDPQSDLTSILNSQDILLCGKCRQLFTDVTRFLRHKSSSAGRCSSPSNNNGCGSATVTSRGLAPTAASDAEADINKEAINSGSPWRVSCVNCDEHFADWQQLCHHCQQRHDIHVTVNQNTSNDTHTHSDVITTATDGASEHLTSTRERPDGAAGNTDIDLDPATNLATNVSV